MGRVVTYLRADELASVLGVDPTFRVDGIEWDPVRRVCVIVWRSDLLVEQEDEDGIEPEAWPVDALRHDGRRSASAERQFRALYEQVPDGPVQCSARSCVLVEGHAADHEDAEGVRFRLAADGVWRVVVPFDEDDGSSDAISEFGRQRDADNGFAAGLAESLSVEPGTLIGDAIAQILDDGRKVVARQAAESAKCPACTGGLMLRETGAVRSREPLLNGRRLRLLGTIFRCADCGHSRAASPSFEPAPIEGDPE